MAALALATVICLHAGKLYRLARYYRAFRCAIDEATGHYRGTIAAAVDCNADASALRTLLTDRPPVQLDDQAELHCDVTATVEPGGGLGRLRLTISGPPDIVAYLYRRLRTDTSINVECVYAPRMVHSHAEVTVAVNVFDATNIAVAVVAAKLER